ncbi:MAG: sigma-70 family RNA polymerase sigma factor [Thermoguttaceae bacterium]|nr:sigma-70 family RNA polymerase sigma factor [Thermoguttaceae bacterium]
MVRNNRQAAYERLIILAEKQGYVTFDNIADCAEEYSLPIQDVDWLSNSITTRGVLVYDRPPSYITSSEEEYDDYAQSDYDAVYDRIVELSPSLETFVNFVRTVVPPQWGEIKQLKYQVVDGNAYARVRMIEMYLRLALRYALQRAEMFDMDIEDAVGYACVGLVTAVDKFDPDSSRIFAQYAVLWILQVIGRGQSTQRPLVHYPTYKKAGYFAAYPILKSYGCVGCHELGSCDKAILMLCEKLDCSEAEAQEVIEQSIPDEFLGDLIELYTDETEECYSRDNIGAFMSDLSPETVASNEDAYRSIQNRNLPEVIAEVLSTLSPRDEKVLRLRFGLDGRERTLEEISKKFNVTRERIRQIEARALRNLRKPACITLLKGYL